MLNDADRRTLAVIEQRIVDEDPVLSLLARRLSAEAHRRERQKRPMAAGPITPRLHLPRELVLMVILTAAVMAAVVGATLGWWIIALSGIVVIAVAGRLFVRVVRCR